jgi:hypothetical protein
MLMPDWLVAQWKLRHALDAAALTWIGEHADEGDTQPTVHAVTALREIVAGLRPADADVPALRE